MTEEILRLQFGTAATTIGTQWLLLQQANKVANVPHVLAFEAKGRITRPIQATSKHEADPSTWGGKVQVYDQSEAESETKNHANELWSWGQLNQQNLVEVDEFRPHMPLHNFYEGRSVSNGGNLSNMTLERGQDRVRTILETCDHLRLVQGLVDMDSSWGGVAFEMMTYVAEECPGATIVVLGNDWSYPMTADYDDAIFRVASDCTKVEARKQINVASSVALLSEVSQLLVPLAMSLSSLPRTAFSHLGVDRSNCADVSTIVATALELALSAHRGKPVYDLLEGFRPGMKVAELAASFPVATDPTQLLRHLNASFTNVNDSNNSIQDPFHNCSVFPALHQADRLHKTYYRRLSFRGFSYNSSLRSAIDSFAVSPQDITLRWSNTSPLAIPESYRFPTLQTLSIDGISQLALTSKTGIYLSSLAQSAIRSNKRILYEFTRTGMSPDALEELNSTLATLSDKYAS